MGGFSGWAELVGAGASILITLFLALKNRAARVAEDDLNRRFHALENARTNCDREVRELFEKMHRAELVTTRIEGDLKLSTSGQQKLERDVAEIKDKMVHRDEWERQMSELREHLDGFVGRFDQLHDALVLKASKTRRKSSA